MTSLKRSLMLLSVLLPMMMVTPTESQAQWQCLICIEFQEPVVGGMRWLHFFDMDSGWACELWGGEMCRACGGTSTCHEGTTDDGDLDIDIGRCHRVRCGATAMADVGAEVSRLVSRLDSGGAPTLALKTALDPRLKYDADRNTVTLSDCDSSVVGRWYLPLDGAIARSYFAVATE